MFDEAAPLEGIYDTLLFSLAMSLALFSVAQLFVRPRLAIHWHSAILFACLGGSLLHAWTLATGLLRDTPFLMHADVCAIACAAPAAYLSADSIIEEARAVTFRQVRHYILPGALIALFIVSKVIPSSAATALGYGLSLSSAGLLCGYTLTALMRGALRRARDPSWRAQEIHALVVFSIGVLAAAVALLVVAIARNERAGDLAIFAYAILIMVYALTRVRWPAHETALLRRGRRQSLLEGLDVESLAARLTRLMEEKKAYRSPDLSLALVGRALGITAHQASELINEKMHTNFRGYVNAYRVRAIQRELIERPQATILEIAFDNGFNSKSTFNTIFTRIAEESPREYRTKRLRKAGG